MWGCTLAWDSSTSALRTQTTVAWPGTKWSWPCELHELRRLKALANDCFF